MLGEKIEQKQVVEFSIKDTGIGIGSEFVEHIFDKFSQEERTTARKYGGTGLGMAITKELVELMQGHITINSKKGTGTEILIEFPFKVGTAHDLPKVNKDLSDTASLEGIRILLAEDNEMNRLVANTVLENYGVLITEAKNGAEAVDALTKDKYDIVLMDMQMPVMNGMEATGVIRNKLKLDIPIIALTANAIKGDSERYMAIGMNGFISKPFEENDLINAIVTVLKLEILNPEAGESKKIKATPNRPLFSLEKLHQIGRGDKGFIDRMINLFLQQMPEIISELHNAFEREDMLSIRKIAHRVKPMIDSLDILSLKDVIRELENAAEKPQSKKRTAELVSQFTETIGQILAIIRS